MGWWRGKKDAGYGRVMLLNTEGKRYGTMIIPPFQSPPIVLHWRGLSFLRMPRQEGAVRYREVTSFQIPDLQEPIDRDPDPAPEHE